MVERIGCMELTRASSNPYQRWREAQIEWAICYCVHRGWIQMAESIAFRSHDDETLEKNEAILQGAFLRLSAQKERELEFAEQLRADRLQRAFRNIEEAAVSGV